MTDTRSRRYNYSMSPLVVDPGGVVIKRVKQGGLELNLHGVVRLGGLLLDVHNTAEPTLAYPLDVQEVIRTYLQPHIPTAIAHLTSSSTFYVVVSKRERPYFPHLLPTNLELQDL